jgi:hypothetical protein
LTKTGRRRRAGRLTIRRSFDDPGKVDENWEAPKSRSADDEVLVSLRTEKPRRVVEEQVG